MASGAGQQSIRSRVWRPPRAIHLRHTLCDFCVGQVAFHNNVIMPIEMGAGG